MADAKTDTVYGWDTEAVDKPNENEYTLLAPGEYPFVVKKFERGRFEGSEKMSACPKAILTLEVDGGEQGMVYVPKDLFLNSKCDGILCSFFTSIGLRKSGDPLVFLWDRIVGRSGRCKIGHREYNDRKYNEVKSFLPPPERSTSTSSTTSAPVIGGDEPDIPF